MQPILSEMKQITQIVEKLVDERVALAKKTKMAVKKATCIGEQCQAKKVETQKATQQNALQEAVLSYVKANLVTVPSSPIKSAAPTAPAAPA